MKKERQNPKAEIEGKQALFVVNLKPRKMAGAEGMIFDIGYADKVVPVLALPERPVPNLTEPARVRASTSGIFAPAVRPVAGRIGWHSGKACGAGVSIFIPQAEGREG
jgi:tRNA-binding EMAP/Myf-like protein